MRLLKVECFIVAKEWMPSKFTSIFFYRGSYSLYRRKFIRCSD